MDNTQNDITPKDDWEVTTNRFVAYIDIMGFKDMVARERHEDIYKRMQGVKSVLKSIDFIYQRAYKNSLIKTTTYSDSIMVYSKDDSFDSLDSIVWTISVISNYLFSQGLPHKGALAFGKMTLDDKGSIFFGQPLIDAYLLQEELYFYGTIVHATAEVKLKEFCMKKEEETMEKYEFSFIENYNCPLKKGQAYHFTVYPTYVKIPIQAKHLPVEYQLSNSISNLRHRTSGSLRKYIDNTEEYIKFIRDKDKTNIK